jgi:ABC-type antimicrobial peptide transport system permease subunit
VLCGVVLSFGAKGVLAWKLPLLTVELPPDRLLVALIIGVIGGTVSALYPGWRAARMDPATALGYE